MKTMHCAAVDLGATSGRVIVGTWSHGLLELKEVHRFPNQFRTLGGRDYWDVPYLWNEARKGLIEAKKLFPKLASVGVDAWGVDHVLVDRDGRMVYPTHAYRDTRTEKLSKNLDRSGLPHVYALTGIPNFSYNTSLQLQETLQAVPSVATAAARCLFLADYFNFLLSGKMENELSISSHSQLLDVHGQSWSPKALKFFGVPAKLFPKAPARSPKALGRVRDFDELGDVESIMVPGHDTACAFAAMPASEDGSDFYLSSGTWSLLGCESKTPILGTKALAARISNERMGQGTFRPLKASLGMWLIEQILPELKTYPKSSDDWDELIAAATAAPASRVRLDVTDRALFRPVSMRKAIDLQLRGRGGRPPTKVADYLRLICDSLAESHRDAMRDFETFAGRKFNRVLMVGGGSKNKLLCQATADACGVPLVSFEIEGSAVGNIAHQLIALGAVPDLATFRRQFARGLQQTIYQPRPN